MMSAMRDEARYREIARYCRKLLRENSQTDNDELLQQLKEWVLECEADADRSLSASRSDEALEQARRYHARAEEYRAVADQLRNPTAIAAYRSLAETYEAMASKLEEPSRRAKQQDAS
jgi:hypothetical protein